MFWASIAGCGVVFVCLRWDARPALQSESCVVKITREQSSTGSGEVLRDDYIAVDRAGPIAYRAIQNIACLHNSDR